MMWQAAGLVDFAASAAMTDRAEMQTAPMRTEPMRTEPMRTAAMRGRCEKWRFPGVSWLNG